MEKIEWTHFKTPFNVVDLSVTTGMSYPASPPEAQAFLMTQLHDYDGPLGDYREFVLIHDDHTGTHVDAPMHFVPPVGSGYDHEGETGDISVEKIPLSQMMGPAVVVDCRPLYENYPKGVDTHFIDSPQITGEYLLNWEKENGRINPGEIVLFFTEWSDRYWRVDVTGPGYDRSYPAPTADAFDVLHERGVQCVGVDTRGIGLMQDDGGPHRAALGRNILAVENLTNLGSLPNRGAYFIFLPHKFEGASGGMGRAIGLLTP